MTRRRKSLLVAGALAVALFAAPLPAAQAAPDVEGTCGRLGCELVAEDSVDVPDTATDPTEDLTNPSAATGDAIAAVYEEQGLPWCRFEGLRRDDEAGLATWDIERGCPEEEATPEEEVAEDEGPTFAEVVAYISSEYLTLPIAPSPISYQPEGDWALINIDFIVYTDSAPQTFHRTLLGMDITFTATPVHYSWDFGDGSPPLSTSSAGNPYPSQDLAHVYSAAQDAAVVTLTTTWQGTFQIDGAGPWYPVATYATTSAQTPPVEIVAMDVHLVP